MSQEGREACAIMGYHSESRLALWAMGVTSALLDALLRPFIFR